MYIIVYVYHVWNEENNQHFTNLPMIRIGRTVYTRVYPEYYRCSLFVSCLFIESIHIIIGNTIDVECPATWFEIKIPWKMAVDRRGRGGGVVEFNSTRYSHTKYNIIYCLFMSYAKLISVQYYLWSEKLVADVSTTSAVIYFFYVPLFFHTPLGPGTGEIRLIPLISNCRRSEFQRIKTV